MQFETIFCMLQLPSPFFQARLSSTSNPLLFSSCIVIFYFLDLCSIFSFEFLITGDINLNLEYSLPSFLPSSAHILSHSITYTLYVLYFVFFLQNYSILLKYFSYQLTSFYFIIILFYTFWPLFTITAALITINWLEEY